MQETWFAIVSLAGVAFFGGKVCWFIAGFKHFSRIMTAICLNQVGCTFKNDIFRHDFAATLGSHVMRFEMEESWLHFYPLEDGSFRLLR